VEVGVGPPKKPSSLKTACRARIFQVVKTPLNWQRSACQPVAMMMITQRRSGPGSSLGHKQLRNLE